MKKNVSIFVFIGFCLLSCHQDIKQKPVLHHVALTTPIKMEMLQPNISPDLSRNQKKSVLVSVWVVLLKSSL